MLRRVVLRPLVFFAVPLRLDAERDLDVPDVDREREVVARDLLVPDVDRALLVPDVDRARLVPDVDRERDVVERDVVDRFAAVALPPLLPAAFFCAVVPPRLEVDRARLVPDVERARDVVERDVVDRFAAVARPPLRPAAFFCAVVPPRLDVDPALPVVERLRLVVDRDELRDVPDLACVVPAVDRERMPEVDRERVPVVDRRGEAALARETVSSVAVSSPTVSAPNRSGINPGTPTDSGAPLGSPKPTESSSRLSPSK